MWLTNYDNADSDAGVAGIVTVLSPTGATLSTFDLGFSAGRIVFDGMNMWVTSGDSVTELSPDGATLGTFPADFPYGMAFDGTHMWVTDLISTAVTEL